MGRRSPAPLSIEIKLLTGTLNRSRERKRLEREQENIQFAYTVVRFFMGERPTEEDPEWVLDGLRNDLGGVATRIWRVYEMDLRQEFRRRHPGSPEPAFWSKYACW